MTEVHEAERAEQRRRNGQQHDQRIDEALVLGREHEEDEDEAERKDDRAQASRGDFVELQARPLVTHPGGHHFLRDLLHRGDRLARAVAGRGVAVEFDVAVQVVVRDDRRGQHLLDRARARSAASSPSPVALVLRRRGTRRRRRERIRSGRNVVCRRTGADVEVLQRRDAVAVRLVGLHVDLPRPVEIREVVDVERGELDLQRIEDVGERDADRFGLVAIDVQLASAAS